MTTKIQGPDPRYVGFIGSESDPQRRCWLVYGIGYTDNQEVSDYVSQKDAYEVTDIDTVPEEYRTAVANLEAYPAKWKGSLTDGADPDQIYKQDAPDGTTVDVRDIIAGLYNN